MGVLSQGVEVEQPLSGRERRLSAFPVQKALENVHRDATEAFPLATQPIGIGLVGYIEAMEQVARVEGRGAAQIR